MGANVRMYVVQTKLFTYEFKSLKNALQKVAFLMLVPNREIKIIIK